MIICLCHRVSDRDIRTAVQSGTLSFDLLQDETGVSTGCGRCGGRSKKNIPASPIASISTGSTASVRSVNSTIAIPPRCTASIPHAIIGGKAAACGFWSILMCLFF